MGAVRAALTAAGPLLSSHVAPTGSGTEDLSPAACLYLFCTAGGPSMIGGGGAWVGAGGQSVGFCCRACLAAHLEMCRQARG